MNISEMVEAFDAVRHEALKFDRIENKIIDNANLCGLNYLHNLHDMHDLHFPTQLFRNATESVCGGGYVALDVNMEKLAEVIKVKDIIYLTRCGIFCSSEGNQNLQYLYLTF